MLGHRTLVVEDYLTILKRRWWILAIPLLILPIATYAFSYTITPQFLSQTLVLIETQKVPDSLVRPIISSDLDGRLASMREQILSRSSIQPIIERYNLYADRKMSMDDRIDLARKNIGIKPITSDIAHFGGLPGFYLSFVADDARTAQLVCTEITSLFVAENLRSREDATTGTTDFIKSQLQDAKRSLDEQDAKLADFERRYVGRLPGQETPNLGMLSSLQAQLQASTEQLARMEQDRSYEETMLTQETTQSASASLNPGSSAPTPLFQGTPTQQAELQALLNQEADLTSHYTDDYPDVKAVRRKIAELRQQIARTPPPALIPSTPGAPRGESSAVQQLRAHIHAMDMGIADKKREQAQIQASIGMYQDRIQSSPQIEQEYKQITRDYQTALGFYDDLLSKMNQSKMATDLEKRQEGEQFTVRDAANLPEAPFSPKRGAFLMGGIAAALAIGLAIIAFLEYRDTALRTERDVWAFTKLPTLAVIAFSEEVAQHAPAPPKGRFARLFNRNKPKPNLAQART